MAVALGSPHLPAVTQEQACCHPQGHRGVVTGDFANRPIFRLEGLSVAFATKKGLFPAVQDVTLEVARGETLGIVGESGSGKTATVMGALGLLPQPPAQILAGAALFDGDDLRKLTPSQLRQRRGREIGVIFQDPTTYLNPVMTVGAQLEEAIKHGDPALSRHATRARAVDLLRNVGVAAPNARVRQYPHEFSGGMRQRVLIAIAIANQPRLLIADEPTTALDVTVQAEILDAIRDAKAETGAGSIFVTHDFGVIAEVADRVAVMYAGRIVEVGPVDQIFNQPRHPYTAALLRSLPQLRPAPGQELEPIPGNPPSLSERPGGCAFHPRCSQMRGRSPCRETRPLLVSVHRGHLSACHFAAELSPQTDDQALRVTP